MYASAQSVTMHGRIINSCARVGSLVFWRAAGKPDTPAAFEGLLVSQAKPDLPDCSRQRQVSLSRWDNEGGARGLQNGSFPGRAQSEVPELTNAELLQLQIRVVAQKI